MTVSVTLLGGGLGGLDAELGSHRRPRVPLPGGSYPIATAPATHRLSPHHGSPATYLVYGYGPGFQSPLLDRRGKLVTVHYGAELGPPTTHRLSAAHDGSGLYFVMSQGAVGHALQVNGEFVKVAKPLSGLGDFGDFGAGEGFSGAELGAALGVEQIIAKLDEFTAWVSNIRTTFVSRFATESSDVSGPVSEQDRQLMSQAMAAWAEGQRLLGTSESFPLPPNGGGVSRGTVLGAIGKLRDALLLRPAPKASSGLSTKAKIGLGIGGAAVVGLIVLGATRKRSLAGARRRR